MNKQKIQDLLREILEEKSGEGLFEVSVSVSPKNEIKVYIDGMQGVGIDQCVEISRYIENRLDREEEDFELTVSSAGLDQPLRVPAQYVKNIGQEVKTVTRDGETLKGRIRKADEEGFSLERDSGKVSRSAQKKKEEDPDRPTERYFKYQDIKETKIVISFK